MSRQAQDRFYIKILIIFREDDLVSINTMHTHPTKINKATYLIYIKFFPRFLLGWIFEHLYTYISHFCSQQYTRFFNCNIRPDITLFGTNDGTHKKHTIVSGLDEIKENPE